MVKKLSISEAVGRLLAVNGWTQVRLAKKLVVDPKTISRYVHGGSANKDHLKSLADLARDDLKQRFLELAGIPPEYALAEMNRTEVKESPAHYRWNGPPGGGDDLKDLSPPDRHLIEKAIHILKENTETSKALRENIRDFWEHVNLKEELTFLTIKVGELERALELRAKKERTGNSSRGALQG